MSEKERRGEEAKMAGAGSNGDETKYDLAADSQHYISDRLYDMCQSEESVSSLMAADEELTPADAWLKLIQSRHSAKNSTESVQSTQKDSKSDQALDRARACGKWGPAEPSDLFLRLYNDAICTLNDDPSRGMVSPSLLGSSGTVPLTIISVLPDIVQHMSNLIVRAEKEVFLATNFWQNGIASRYVTDAIRELSKRAEARGSRVIMKVLYDRGNPRQIIDPHHSVQESEYTGNSVNLPPEKDIPWVDLQVINYHQPMLGTFHAKYMIVDRRIGVVQSNNIQDNDNLEMMVQLEGPIVDSLYDMALLSWHKKLDPPLPCLESPAARMEGASSFNESWGNLFSPEGSIKGHSAVVDPMKMRARKPYGAEAVGIANGSTAETIQQRDFAEMSMNPADIANPSSDSRQSESGGDKTLLSQNTPSLDKSTSQSRDSILDHPSAQSLSPPPRASKETWREHTTHDPHYDNSLADEVLRVQASVSAQKSGEETAMEAVNRHLNHTVSEGYPGSAPNCDTTEAMTPYIPHPAHEPFPMALVNRAPYGRPNHRSLENPQNAAWLSALRNAQKNVFIQTPTLNAEPLIPAITEACERGVDVYCYVCLGYNDAGEMLPLQGGHNEKIAHQLYTNPSLSPKGRSHLHWQWYVAKDQAAPIPASQKKRSCHIKLMIADERVAIVGSGNQDTQSWFHSQEVNVMLDSPFICRAWIEALRRNQNTGHYGQVCREDGIWRYDDDDDEGKEIRKGKEIEGATGVDAGRFPWVKGLVGAVRRLQGTGGF